MIWTVWKMAFYLLGKLWISGKKTNSNFFFYKFLISVSEIAVVVSQRSPTLVAHMSTYTVNAFPANLYVPEDITVLLKHLAPIEEWRYGSNLFLTAVKCSSDVSGSK